VRIIACGVGNLSTNFWYFWDFSFSTYGPTFLSDAPRDINERSFRDLETGAHYWNWCAWNHHTEILWPFTLKLVRLMRVGGQHFYQLFGVCLFVGQLTEVCKFIRCLLREFPGRKTREVTGVTCLLLMRTWCVVCRQRRSVTFLCQKNNKTFVRLDYTFRVQNVTASLLWHKITRSRWPQLHGTVCTPYS